MFPPTHPIYGAYRPRTRCCIQNKRAGLMAVIGICLFFCGILIAINTLYDLQTIPLPIHTHYNLKVHDSVNDERRKLSDVSGGTSGTVLRDGEAAAKRREQEEVERVKAALLEYLEEPNRMSMQVHLPDGGKLKVPKPTAAKAHRGFSLYPLTPERAKLMMEIWLQHEGTEFIETKFREQQEQIVLQTLTKLHQDSMKIPLRYQVEIKIDEIDKLLVERVLQEMLQYFSTGKKMCIIPRLTIEERMKVAKVPCTVLSPEEAQDMVKIWMKNGGEEFIKCEFRKTGKQTDPLSYDSVLSSQSKDNQALYGGQLMIAETRIAPGNDERVASCTPRAV